MATDEKLYRAPKAFSENGIYCAGILTPAKAAKIGATRLSELVDAGRLEVVKAPAVIVEKAATTGREKPANVAGIRPSGRASSAIPGATE